MRTALLTLALALAAGTPCPGNSSGYAPGNSPGNSPGTLHPVQDGGLHKDPRFGFQFKPPRNWTSIALKSDEGWLTAKYLSDKTYFYTDKDIGWTMEHQPELMVIAFQLDRKKREVKTEEEEDGVKVTTITIDNPYKDYEDFLDRTYQGGGWFVSEKEEIKVGDLKVTRYEVKVEKLARTGPKRIFAWLYHTEDIDYAMQVEVLESEHKKLKRVLERSLKSFVEIERNGELLPSNKNAVGAVRFTRKELTSGTPKERRTVRVESQKELHERAIASLPKDWKHKYHGDVLVLEHNENKWAARLGSHLEAVLKYIEKEFSYFGKGEYARAPVVRVCDDEVEAASFSRGVVSGTGGSYQWVYPGSEIITFKDDAGFIGYEVEDVNRQMFSLWLAERDDDLLAALPEWISIGIYEYVGGARLDGRKLDFRVDQSDWDRARLNIAQGRDVSVREIVRFTREEFMSSSGGSGGEYWDNRAAATMLVRFLLEKDSDRCKQAKGLLEKYITALAEVLIEAKEKEGDSRGSSKAPETEEEEEAQAKARSERWRAREKELMGDTFERVFGDWTDKDWQSFEKAYTSWLK